MGFRRAILLDLIKFIKWKVILFDAAVQAILELFRVLLCDNLHYLYWGIDYYQCLFCLAPLTGAAFVISLYSPTEEFLGYLLLLGHCHFPFWF